MLRRLGIIAGFSISLLLLLSALWAWQNADELALRWHLIGDWAAWGARCGAIGIAAAAQVIVLSIIGRCIYNRDLITDILRLGGVLVVMLCGVAAVALALAGR